MKPMLKPPGTKRLKLKYDKLLLSFAFEFNLRRCTMVSTWSNPMLIRMTQEGRAVGARMHVAAEERGDCRCGLMSPEDTAVGHRRLLPSL